MRGSGAFRVHRCVAGFGLEPPRRGVKDGYQPNRDMPLFMAERRRRVRTFEWSTAVIALTSVVAGTIVYLRDGSDKALAILSSDLWLFTGMLPKMAAGCLIAAFVTRLLPREVVARVVGSESGFVGILVAMVMGAVLPGGPLTIYPVAGAFLLLGADIGTAVAFITAWNLLGYNRALIWELPFFGPEFLGWRIMIALPLPIIAGLLARAAARMVARRWGGDDQWT